jgi:large subunit ribosomal protein L15
VCSSDLNLDSIQALVEKTNVTVVDTEVLYNNGLVSKTDLVKILNRGELKVAVEVKAHAFSKTAVEAIEKAGGKAVTL